MKRGVVGIKGVKTNLYLCLSADGAAYGSVRAHRKRQNRESKCSFTRFCSLNAPTNRHVDARLSSYANIQLFVLG